MAMRMAGYGGPELSMGVYLVKKLYAYCKTQHPKTLVMAGGLRSKKGKC
jgi:hypothetical protein